MEYAPRHGQLQITFDAKRTTNLALDRDDLYAAMLLDVRQVAARLGCGRTLVFELIARGELPVVKLGRLTRIPESALRDFIALRTPTTDRGEGRGMCR